MRGVGKTKCGRLWISFSFSLETFSIATLLNRNNWGKKVRNILNARQKCKKLSLQKEISAFSCLRLYFRMNLANFPDNDLPFFHSSSCVQEYLQMHISHEVGSKFGSIFSCYKDIDVFFLTCLMNSVNHKSFLMETTCLPRTV